MFDCGFSAAVHQISFFALYHCVLLAFVAERERIWKQQWQEVSVLLRAQKIQFLWLSKGAELWTTLRIQITNWWLNIDASCLGPFVYLIGASCCVFMPNILKKKNSKTKHVKEESVWETDTWICKVTALVSLLTSKPETLVILLWKSFQQNYFWTMFFLLISNKKLQNKTT